VFGGASEFFAVFCFAGGPLDFFPFCRPAPSPGPSAISFSFFSHVAACRICTFSFFSDYHQLMCWTERAPDCFGAPSLARPPLSHTAPRTGSAPLLFSFEPLSICQFSFPLRSTSFRWPHLRRPPIFFFFFFFFFFFEQPPGYRPCAGPLPLGSIFNSWRRLGLRGGEVLPFFFSPLSPP